MYGEQRISFRQLAEWIAFASSNEKERREKQREFSLTVQVSLRHLTKK